MDDLIEESNMNNEWENYVLTELLNEGVVRDGINRDYVRENAVGVFVSSNAMNDNVLKELSLLKSVTLAIIYRLMDLTLLVTTIGLCVAYLKSQSTFYFQITILLLIVPSTLFALLSLTRILFSLKRASSTEIPIKTAIAITLSYAVFPSIGAYEWWKFTNEQRRVSAEVSTSSRHRKTSEIIRLADEVSALFMASNFFQGTIQFLLQWYIISVVNTELTTPKLVALQKAVISCSLISMVLASVAIDDSLIRLQWSRGLIITALWKLFSISARMIVLGLCLTTSWKLMISFCFAHMALSTLAIFCKVDGATRLQKLWLTPLLSIIYIITDLNLNYPKRSPHRLLFYACTFLEAITVVTLWIKHTNEYSVWYHYWIAVLVYVLYFIGILLCRFRHEYEYSLHYYCSKRFTAGGGRLSTYMFNSCLGYPDYN